MNVPGFRFHRMTHQRGTEGRKGDEDTTAHLTGKLRILAVQSIANGKRTEALGGRMNRVDHRDQDALQITVLQFIGDLQPDLARVTLNLALSTNSASIAGFVSVSAS
ncbi:hypothetical protein [Caballeronia insecticola]|uniref:hypothetical protein n=1 Tax=Caballeronia insecticola TaxID=758793 RepID=UPI001181EB74|nr:hypothetical protein [Caballeronia insecticola]